MTGEHKQTQSVFLSFKRMMDALLAGAAIVALAPVMLFVAIAVKLDSRGPALFRQERLGLDGKPFMMVKFRSMTVGAEAGGVYVTEGDARVTRVGEFIRRTSLDELPQLFNILRGDMSIIGPRPVLTYHPWPLEEYTDEQRRRFDVRPGLSGWAQVNGRKTVEWPQRLEFDVEYIEKMSLAFDIKIFLMTVARVLSGSDNANTTATVTSEKGEEQDSAEGNP